MSTIDPSDLPEHPGTIEWECDECGEIFVFCVRLAGDSGFTAPRMTMSDKCPYCGRQRNDNPGDYYHEKDCEAKAIITKIRLLKTEIEKLERKLEAARYVGD